MCKGASESRETSAPLRAVIREKGPGLAEYIFAELLDPDVGDNRFARLSTVLRRVTGRGPAACLSSVLLGPYHTSWAT